MELPVYQREFNDQRPSWTDLTPRQQEQWINDMATYAAMIEIMDDGIGRLIEAVKEKGIYENTVFLFMSDNGATSEGGYLGQLMADLSNTPYRSYKQWCFQGGTSSPLIIKCGDSVKRGIKEKGTICPGTRSYYRSVSYLSGYGIGPIPFFFSGRESEIVGNQSFTCHTELKNCVHVICFSSIRRLVPLFRTDGSWYVPMENPLGS